MLHNTLQLTLDKMPADIIGGHIIPKLGDLKYIVTLSQVNKELKKIIENAPIIYHIVIDLGDAHHETISGTYSFISKNIQTKQTAVNTLQKENKSLNRSLNVYDCLSTVCINFYSPLIKPDDLGCIIADGIGGVACIGTTISAGVTSCFGCMPAPSCFVLGFVSILSGCGANFVANAGTQVALYTSTKIHRFFSEKANTTEAKILENQNEIHRNKPTGMRMC